MLTAPTQLDPGDWRRLANIARCPSCAGRLHVEDELLRCGGCTAGWARFVDSSQYVGSFQVDVSADDPDPPLPAFVPAAGPARDAALTALLGVEVARALTIVTADRLGRRRRRGLEPRVADARAAVTSGVVWLKRRLGLPVRRR